MSERMRYLGVLGLLCECSVHVDEDTRESIQSALEDACADGRLRWTRTLDRYDIEAVPGAPIATPSNRILELELEVKRLRSTLAWIERGLAGMFGRPGKSWHEELLELVPFRIERALSTPRPALAEAYVRLRDAGENLGSWVSASLDDPNACKEFHSDSSKFLDALAEIDKLEKGE